MIILSSAREPSCKVLLHYLFDRSTTTVNPRRLMYSHLMPQYSLANITEREEGWRGEGGVEGGERDTQNQSEGIPSAGLAPDP